MKHNLRRLLSLFLLFAVLIFSGFTSYQPEFNNLSVTKKLTVKELGKNNTISDKILSNVYKVKLPNATYNKLPGWKGFNLLEKFMYNTSFTEDEFRTISKLGYNFVRLPMSYKTWINDGDWNSFNEDTLRNIDKAIEYGIKYNIHINISFHRAPGFTVNSPKETKDLWTDASAQKAFAVHWAMFAKRYAGIPNTILSFNLVNEPTSDVSDATYTKVMAKAIVAIRKEDPNRLIIVDGLNYATTPCQGLVKYKVAQSIHSYEPFTITHYKADWVEGSDSYPDPQWPMVSDISSFLYSPGKPEFNKPIIISGAIPEGKLGIHVTQVSNSARIIVEADGKKIMDKNIQCTGGEGDWYKVVYSKEWNIYQNLFDTEYTCNIPKDTKKLKIYLSEGDWLTFSNLKLYQKDGTEFSKINATEYGWGSVSKEISIKTDGSYITLGGYITDKDWIIKNYLQKWVDFSKKNKIGIMVGEWGVHNETPHDVTLAFMKAKLDAFKELGLGWALWNFNGSFGIVDSDRSDVDYTDYDGYNLDQEMADLLNKYIK